MTEKSAKNNKIIDPFKHYYSNQNLNYYVAIVNEASEALQDIDRIGKIPMNFLNHNLPGLGSLVVSYAVNKVLIPRKVGIYGEAIRKQQNIQSALKNETDASKERRDYLLALFCALSNVIAALEKDLL